MKIREMLQLRLTVSRIQALRRSADQGSIDRMRWQLLGLKDQLQNLLEIYKTVQQRVQLRAFCRETELQTKAMLSGEKD